MASQIQTSQVPQILLIFVDEEDKEEPISVQSNEIDECQIDEEQLDTLE